ncbi:MAG TPA: hypothetical protein VLV83_22190 [Acidobacteriota bacterium]|nr:hypothetical protein [Acidobacteriota bacterium]
MPRRVDPGVTQQLKKTRFGTTAFLAFQDVDGSFPFARSESADRKIYLDLARRAGLTDLREAVLQWGQIQSRQGDEFDFSAMDDLVVQAGEHGIEILGIFTGLPLWATVSPGERDGDFSLNMSPQDPRTWLPRKEFEDDFRHFVRTAVGRYGSAPDRLAELKKPIRYWEFYNEVDAGWWQDPEDHAYWLKAFTEEVKKADPEAQVVLAGLASAAIRVANPPHRHNPGYLEDLLAAESLKGPGYPYFDVVNLHNYPMLYGAQPISGEVREAFRRNNPQLDPAGLLTGYEPLLHALQVMKAYVRRVLDSRQLDMPVWLTEIGDDSRFTGRREQSSRLVKYLLHTAWLGFERVYQFCLYDLGTQDGQGQWGLVELNERGSEPASKPAFHAVRTFLDYYARADGVIRLAPGVYRLAMREGPDAFYLWQSSPVPPLLPPQIDGRLRTVDLEGNHEELPAQALRLNSHPLLVIPE